MMLKSLFKLATKKEPEMAVTDKIVEVVVASADTELQAALSAMTSQFEASQAALAEAQAALEVFAAEREASLIAAKAAKTLARTKAVEAKIGTAKAPALVTATESLDDTAFEAIVSALSVSLEVEGKSEMFREVGIDAQADKTTVQEESGEMKILKAKYAKRGAKAK
jgi:hypothetical protein